MGTTAEGRLVGQARTAKNILHDPVQRGAREWFERLANRQHERRAFAGRGQGWQSACRP